MHLVPIYSYRIHNRVYIRYDLLSSYLQLEHLYRFHTCKISYVYELSEVNADKKDLVNLFTELVEIELIQKHFLQSM